MDEDLASVISANEVLFLAKQRGLNAGVIVMRVNATCITRHGRDMTREEKREVYKTIRDWRLSHNLTAHEGLPRRREIRQPKGEKENGLQTDEH